MATTCFCGCGREIDGLRPRANNEAGKQMTRDLEVMRGALEWGEAGPRAAETEAMASEARIPAALKGQVAAIGTQLQSTPDVEFGEGDAKKPLHELFRDLLRALPPQVEFGEQATRDRAASDSADKASDTPVEFAEGADPDRVAQDKRIRAYAATNKVDYATAAHAVMRSK